MGEGMSPEAELWSSVLVIEIRDAKRGDAQARAWLARRSPDLVTVCALAGIDPDWLLRLAPRLTGRALGVRALDPSAEKLLARLAALRQLTA